MFNGEPGPIGIAGDELLEQVNLMDPHEVELALNGILLATGLSETLGQPLAEGELAEPFGSQIMDFLPPDRAGKIFNMPGTPDSPAPTKTGRTFDDGGTGPGEEM